MCIYIIAVYNQKFCDFVFSIHKILVIAIPTVCIHVWHKILIKMATGGLNFCKVSSCSL